MRIFRNLLSGTPTPSSTSPSTALAVLPPTPLATPSPTPASTLGSTLVLVPEPPAAYIIRNNTGTVVDLSREGVSSPHPETHAWKLLGALIEEIAGEPATERAIKKYYASVCRAESVRPFPWLAVVRQFNRLLREIYGPAYKKTYANVYEGGRPRKRRVYRVPLVEEVERALKLAEADVTRVA